MCAHSLLDERAELLSPGTTDSYTQALHSACIEHTLLCVQGMRVQKVGPCMRRFLDDFCMDKALAPDHMPVAAH